MLVLTRKTNQSIMIGDNIEVSVLAIMGEKVRIGIQADRSVPVFRKEVYLEIQAEHREESSKTEAGDTSKTEAGDTSKTEVGEASRTEANEDAPDGRIEVDAALRSLGKPK